MIVPSRSRQVLAVALLLCLTLAATLVGSRGAPTTAAIATPSAVPELPAGWPSTVELGTVDDPGGAAATKATAPFGFRYHYLAGGVNTGGGWATWDPDGQFVTRYVDESIQHGMTPVFSYYMIRQSVPGNSMAEADGVHANLQNASVMTAYFEDLKLFYERAGEFPDRMVVLHVEPDLWGYMQQRAKGDDAATVLAKVAATGMPELVDLPDNAAGVARAVVKLRDLYAPNVVLGYSISIWGTGVDILDTKPSDARVDELATRAGNFYRSLQAPFDISFAEFSDRDAGFKQYVDGFGKRLWWDVADFGRHARFLARFMSVAENRAVLWQIPLGNTKMRAMNNTWYHYQDNKVEWLLDDPARVHLNEYVQAGVVAFLFGGGADGTTCACDASEDGLTDPEPINGNALPSINADDDGGFFRQKARQYYADGAVLLSTTGDVSLTSRALLASEPSARLVSPAGEVAPAPLPVISRRVPAYTSATASPYGPQLANDDNYGTNWRSVAIPAWLAYDLSSVPVDNRGQVLLAWYNNATGDYDHSLGGTHAYNIPGAYTIEANASPGGAAVPESGWATLASVTDNVYHSRQHLIDLTGYNWVRISVTASEGSPSNDDVALNLDVHDASQGVEDDWIFYGDSITAAGMAVSPAGAVGTFAQLISARVPSHFPVQEAGGIGYLRSDEGARRIDTWLSLFPGRYVGLSFGTNDCGAISPEAFYQNYVTLVEAVLRAGKVPVVSKIPWARISTVQTYGPALNAKIDELYAAYPQVIRGPDFWTYFQQNPSLVSQDDLHPTPEGDAAYRRQWADQMAAAVYGTPLARTR